MVSPEWKNVLPPSNFNQSLLNKQKSVCSRRLNGEENAKLENYSIRNSIEMSSTALERIIEKKGDKKPKQFYDVPKARILCYDDALLTFIINF